MQSAEKMLSLKWSSFPSQLAVSMDTCYEKQQFVDVSLVCKDGTILKCHKMVLANASTFFCRLLVANEHPHPMIILHDIDADDLKTIINFMYCGEIQVVQSEVKRLLRIANILEVTGLTQIQNTAEPGSPDLENRVFEAAKADQRNNKNGPEINSGFSKLVPVQRLDSSSIRFDASGPRFDSSGPRFDPSGPRFESSGPRFDSSGPRFDSGGPRLLTCGPIVDNSARFDPSGARFDSNSARFDNNTARFDNNARFDPSVPRFDSSVRFDSSSVRYDNNSARFENNNPRIDPSGRFDMHQRFDFNPIRFDSNISNPPRYDSSGFRFDSSGGRFPLNAIRFPRRDNVAINQRRVEVFNRSQEPRKDFIPGVEAIQTNRLRLAKAGIDIQEGNNIYFQLMLFVFFVAIG